MCVNCLGQHGARFLDCPYLQQCRDLIKKTRATNITHQVALHRDEANNRLQDQVTELKEQVGKIVKQTEEQSSKHQTNISKEIANFCKILQEVKSIQAQI